MESQEERTARVLGRMLRDNEEEPTETWVLRAASIIGVIALNGLAESDPEKIQGVIEELFVKMPSSLSIAAANVTAEHISRNIQNLN